ncbi:MAG: hypothetical protein JWR87_3407 [Segetibacter sp.]|jgi:hypothetical protein|nr:hypothetical protein [Segetibacter sp.]
MYTTYAGNYSLEYYNSLTELSFKVKALIRLFKIKRTVKTSML